MQGSSISLCTHIYIYRPPDDGSEHLGDVIVAKVGNVNMHTDTKIIKKLLCVCQGMCFHNEAINEFVLLSKGRASLPALAPIAPHLCP